MNPGPSKPAHEIVFSKKHSKNDHPDIYFNNAKVKKETHQKHLGIFLDQKWNSKYHIDRMKLTNVFKGAIKSK